MREWGTVLRSLFAMLGTTIWLKFQKLLKDGLKTCNDKIFPTKKGLWFIDNKLQEFLCTTSWLCWRADGIHRRGILDWHRRHFHLKHHNQRSLSYVKEFQWSVAQHIHIKKSGRESFCTMATTQIIQITAKDMLGRKKS